MVPCKNNSKGIKEKMVIENPAGFMNYVSPWRPCKD